MFEDATLELDQERLIEPAKDTTSAFRESFLWLARTLPSCVFCPADPKRALLEELATRAALVVEQAGGDALPQAELIELIERLGLMRAAFNADIATSSLPCIAVMPGQGLGIVREHLKDEGWLLETAQGLVRHPSFAANTRFLTFESPEHSETDVPVTARQALYRIFFAHKAWIIQLFIASALASFLLLGTSFYSMQVYDRVVSNGGIPTLIVLTIGVLFALVVEFLLKLVRMSITHAALNRIEIEMATYVFQVMLGIRLDLFPQLLGALSAQLRGFESVKTYLSTRTTFLVCELPFCFFFLSVICLVGGPLMIVVPSIALGLALASGLLFRKRIRDHAKKEQGSSRNRQGHLIETLKNIELIKAHGAEWRMQGVWNQLTGKTVREGSKSRSGSEIAAALGQSIQQISYVGLVAVGACLAIGHATVTTGTIVACSILSGRIFAPIARLPSLLVQWAYAEGALESLDKLFERHRNSGKSLRPLLVSDFEGGCELRDIAFAYEPKSPKISLPYLRICGGEKVAILGPVGSGKSTFLKIIAGLIRPNAGQVLIDGLDVFAIAAERRAELIGYLPQSPGLIQGTLRENLLMGHTGISDDQLIMVCKSSGLDQVLLRREQGLETPVHEGGSQFSGGEIQLIALTRLLLVSPRLWLLDEPTAACDAPGERRVLAALKARLGKQDTLVLVTHKTPPLELVDRVIVIDGKQILADGPKEQVLQMDGGQ